MTTFSIQPANQPIGLVHVKRGDEETYLIKVNSMCEYAITRDLYNELMDILQSNAKAFSKMGELIASKTAKLIEYIN